MKCILRKAGLKDLEEIDKIYVEGSLDEGKLQFPNVSKKEMINQLKKYSTSRKKGFKKEIKKDYWLVVEKDNSIIGFGQAKLNNKETGMIEKIYIDKKYRKKGIGEKIALKLIKWLKEKKVKHIESDIYWNNKPSIKLHKKLKFKPISLKMRLK